MTRRSAAIAAVGILAVFWVQYLGVRPTNFGGWDEWLVIDLTYRGIVALPYQNRPFSLIFSQPGALLLPGRLLGYYLAHGLYLSLAGVLLFQLCRRLAPGEERIAFLAGVLCVGWAPLDAMRLNPVLVASYAGFSCATLLALVLLVESARTSHLPGLVLAAALAFGVVRGLEATAGLVLLAPALLWLVPGIERRTRIHGSAVWLAAAGAAAVLAAAPLFPGQPGSYQVMGLGFDPHPLRVLGRVLRQFGFHLGPLVSPSPGELRAAAAGAAVGVFLATWLLRRHAEAGEAGRGDVAGRPALRLVLVGFVMAALGYGVMVLSPSVSTPARMQILSAPGIGLLLAALVFGVAGPLSGRWREVAIVVLGAWLVALGAGRTAALQRQWDATSYWGIQSRGLARLTREIPQVAPHTLIVLIDEAEAWPAAFTFHHAVEFLYRGRAGGTVWGAVPFLYPIELRSEGILSVPYESIRGPWRSPVALYRWDEIVVVRQSAEGEVAVLDAWPGTLPPLPPSARYDPRARIRLGEPPPREHALVAPAAWPAVR